MDPVSHIVESRLQESHMWLSDCYALHSYGVAKYED
jgi:hypothetical protein